MFYKKKKNFPPIFFFFFFFFFSETYCTYKVRNMFAECGKMSLLMFIAAMLVQNVLTTNDRLVEVDPFENIPGKLSNLMDCDTTDLHEKLEELALIGLNKLRTANGVTGNLTCSEKVLSFWSMFTAEALCRKMTEEGEQEILNIILSLKNESHFDQQYEYKTEAEKGNSSTSGFVIKSIRDWYKKIQAKVKNGREKESIGLFNPDTKYVGYGFQRMTKAVNGKTTYYINFVLTFATEDKMKEFNNELKTQTSDPKPDPPLPEETHVVLQCPPEALYDKYFKPEDDDHSSTESDDPEED
uniref:Uncharacterized protein n=1 Tax=Cacopsylla melanoneura TaxID=428564 RepID=A0A8D8X9Z0_9HEMI